VWSEVSKLGLFSDCQWNQKLVDPQKPNDKENKNELDVTMIHNAQLFIGECKTETGKDAFKSEQLYKLDSVASSLGGRFVSKIFITSEPTSKISENFRNRANEKGITIITREELNDIGSVIENLVKHPKHARI
jgi:Card1-like endonuclease family protein